MINLKKFIKIIVEIGQAIIKNGLIKLRLGMLGTRR